MWLECHQLFSGAVSGQRGDFMRKLFLTSALTLAATMMAMVPMSSHANLSIDKLWVDFEAGESGRSDVVIRNDSEDRYYISVTVSEILNPGTEDEERVQEVDPEKIGLLVTPNRIVLDPGSIRSIRLVSLNQALPKDRVYRVLISPQVGAIKAKANAEDEQSIAIKLLAAYDVLVVARPNGSAPEIESERNAERVTLKNVGNTNVLVLDGFVCPEEAGDEPSVDTCTVFPTKRLFSGGEMDIDLNSPSDRVILRTKSAATGSAKLRNF